MKMYGSEHCHECREAKQLLEENGYTTENYEYIDITSSMKTLREFIYFREEHTDLWEPLRPYRAVGVPCFVFEDGTIIFDAEAALKKLK